MNQKRVTELSGDTAEEQKAKSSMAQEPKEAVCCRFACDPDIPQKNKAWIYGSAGTVEQNAFRPPHVEKLTAEAKQRGYIIVGTSYDAGIKGEPVHRPGIRLMLEAVQRGEVDIVMMTSGSQISRCMEKRLPVLTPLYKNGVQLYCQDTGRIETPPSRHRRKEEPER